MTMISPNSTNLKSVKLACGDMRKNVIDRLIDTHYGLKLESKTFNLCVNILDQFISKSNFEATTKEKFEFRYLT